MPNMIKLTQAPFNMNIAPIRTEQDYQNALKRLAEIFEAKADSQEGEELEILSVLIEHYENKYFPIELPDPVEAIKFRMEQMNLKQKDLASLIGFKSRVSEVLNRKRKLNLEMIRKLSRSLNIPTDVLIQDY